MNSENFAVGSSSLFAISTVTDSSAPVSSCSLTSSSVYRPSEPAMSVELGAPSTVTTPAVELPVTV
jgi:hypothetical protein